jgi:hypothetical protein
MPHVYLNGLIPDRITVVRRWIITVPTQWAPNDVR